MVVENGRRSYTMSPIFSYISSIFPETQAISRPQFRQFLDISVSTDHRMKRSGDYPVITIVGNTEKILLVNLASYLESRQEDPKSPTSPIVPRKKRGRPKGSKNKPKNIDAYKRKSPALPVEMRAELGIF